MMNVKEKQTANAALDKALSILPLTLRADIEKTIYAHKIPEDTVTDIRLRRGGGSYLSAGRRSYRIGADISAAGFDDMIFAITGGSLYAHAETIREGYISVGGIRCGVCGRAVTRGGEIGEVCDISSVSIRVARDIPGCASRVLNLILRGGTVTGALIYSPPGVGKTTLLRDLIRGLSERGCQLSVIDSRRELASAAAGESVDLLSGYPKAEGIICAVRSLSPEAVICDELSGMRDAEAALYAYSCGVPIIATAHAGSMTELHSRREMKILADAGVFKHLIGLRRRVGEEMSYIINGS